MAHEALASADPADRPLFSPWPVVLTGLGLSVAGWLAGLAVGGWLPVVPVLLVVAGVLAAAAALAAYLPHARWDWEGRLLVAGLWGLAALTAVFGMLALSALADSIALALLLAVLVSATAALVSLLPARWRLLAVSLLLLLHGAAIFTAVTVIPAPNGQAPWLIQQLWTRYTRPYLQLTNLNNAYHFYSPEPGPCALVWFRVQWADGVAKWVRIPNHNTVRNHLERRRYGSLATSLGQTIPMENLPPEIIAKRARDAQRYDPPIPPAEAIPLPAQYREPGPMVKLLLSSYARYIARTTPHPDGADSPVTGVRIYRVDYMNPPVEHFQAGRDPVDPTLYSAWYQGEFDAQGKLKLSSGDELLYWLIPIVRVPEEETTETPEVPQPRQTGPGRWQSEGKVINFVRIHAGEKGEEGVP